MTVFLQNRFALPALSSGALSALKWLALVLMVVDHVEAYWLHRQFDSQLGRLVFPIFAIVLGYNLARPACDHAAVFGRLLVFACIAWPFHAWLTHAPLSLNVLFTFAIAVFCISSIETRKYGAAALALFVCGGALVEYVWPGIALVIAVWGMYARAHNRSGVWVLLACASLLGLCLLNGTATAVFGVPLVWAMRGYAAQLPRLRWAFYAFYPAHLALFVALGAPGL